MRLIAPAYRDELKMDHPVNRANMANRLDAGPSLRERMKDFPPSDNVIDMGRQTFLEALTNVRGDRENFKGDKQPYAEQESAGGKEDYGGGRTFGDRDPREDKVDKGSPGQSGHRPYGKGDKQRVLTRNELYAVASSLRYETQLTPSEELQFQRWKHEFAPNDSGFDYDLRGAFKAGLRPDAQTGHWPDTFKKPNHPTFSDESIYAKDRPDLAGRWTGTNHDQYVPARRRP